MPIAAMLPPLAPRHSQPRPPTIPRHPSLPTQREWAALYSEIERLYVQERRRLRFVMQHMEKEYGFKATEQMYKKRFTIWGFFKSHRRLHDTGLDPKSDYKEGAISAKLRLHPPRPSSIPACLKLGHQDRQSLMFMASARAYSVAFFQSLQLRNGQFESSPRPPLPKDPASLEKAKGVSIAFRLVTDLLDRGHGTLAGRMARKAFLLVESILVLEGPTMVWNLLEMMHHILMSRQTRLFHMLLAHLTALVNGHVPSTHPLPSMLRGLLGLLREVHRPDSSISMPSITLPLDHMTDESRRLLASVLERAWTQNAKNLFDHFDDRLFYLYICVHWDSCSIEPPREVTSAMTKWTTGKKTASTADDSGETDTSAQVFGAPFVEEAKMIQCLLCPRVDASPPQSFEMLRISSMRMMREYGNSMISKRIDSPSSTIMDLRVLAALVIADAFEKKGALLQPPKSETKGPRVPRAHAQHLACTVKTLIGLDAEHANDKCTDIATIGRLNSIITLREYALGEIDPHVVRDMWLLKDALTRSGQHLEAQKVAQDALSRVEQYITDIPNGSA